MPIAKKKQPCVVTREPVDVEGLLSLAHRRAAATVCWPGSDVPIRRVLLDFVAAAGVEESMTAVWNESAGFESTGFKTRRFSGGEAKEAPSVPMSVAGRSLSTLPRALRTAGRAGLHNAVDVDQRNSHFEAQSARHSGRPALLAYIR